MRRLIYYVLYGLVTIVLAYGLAGIALLISLTIQPPLVWAISGLFTGWVGVILWRDAIRPVWRHWRAITGHGNGMLNGDQTKNRN